MANKEQQEKGEPEASREKVSSGAAKPSNKPKAGITSNPFTGGWPHSAGHDERLPIAVEFGQVTTFGEVMARKPGDPPFQAHYRIEQPTAQDIVSYCQAMMDAQKEEKKMFGPERPPKQE